MSGYTVTLSTVAGIARELSGTDANGLTNQKVFDFANMSMLKLRKYLIEHGIDVSVVQETQGTITDAVGEYLYPSDMWLPKDMEINWFQSPVTANNFVPVDKVSDTNLPQGATINWLRKNQAVELPMVDYRGDYYEVFPTPSATTWGGTSGSTLSNAITFFYYLQPTLYTDNTNLTDSVVYPENLDYHSFAKLISAHYDFSIGKIDNNALESTIKFEVTKLIDVIQGDGRGVTKTKSIPWTGWEF